MKILVFVFLLLVFLLFLPIRLRGKITYNLFTNQGVLSIFFYKIQILVAGLKFIPIKIELETANNKTFIYLTKSKDTSITFGDIFFDKLIRQLQFKNIRIIGKFGLLCNPFLTSIEVGLIQSLSGVLLCFLQNNKNTNLKNNIYPDFYYTKFLVCFTSSIQFNFFTILKCLFASILVKFDKH